MDPRRHAYPYCPICRAALARREEGGAVRPWCAACGFVQYLNPAPAAAVIVRRGERILLTRRRYAPREGLWTLPAGFLEYDEPAAAAARREAVEETGLEVEIEELFAVHHGILPPDRSVILIVYRARELAGELRAGDDAQEVGFFTLDDLPGPIAFSSHRKVLDALREEMREGHIS
ncbi:NUDIX domain-containing protein [bacterium]|nr:NUDIX domain-containing protein [bacterium]MBU1676016.1 NUDIX domain-containing protein [bacterium]